MEQLARFTREGAAGAWRVIAREGLAVGERIDVYKRGRVAHVRVGAMLGTLGNGEATYEIQSRSLSKRDAGRSTAENAETTTTHAEVAETMEQNGNGAVVGTVDAAVAALIKATQAHSKLDEDRVIALIEQHATKRTHVTHSVDLTKRDGTVERIAGQHKQFATLLEFVAAKVPVMLVGPAGSGKTSAARAVAKALNAPFFFTGAVVDRFALLGFRDAQSRVVETQLSLAIKQASVFLFDELDGSGEDAVLSFHAPIDNRVADMPEGQVQVHDECAFIASANTYGRGADRMYVGRTQLDAATLDRFAVLDWDYDYDLERDACANAEWCERVQSVRTAVMDLKIRHVVSMRATFQGEKLLARGMARTQVEDSVLWRGLDADSRAKVERAL